METTHQPDFSQVPEPSSQIAASPAPPSPAGRGRRRFLTSLKCQEICSLVNAGCGIEGAARHVGCAPKTIHREARRNPQFGAALRHALIAAELHPLNALRSAAARHWRAAAWLLERTNPQQFVRQPAGAIKPEQLEQFAEQLRRVIISEVGDVNTHNRMLGRIRLLLEDLHSDPWFRNNMRYVDPRRPPKVKHLVAATPTSLQAAHEPPPART
jgi:hypothetical protein